VPFSAPGRRNSSACSLCLSLRRLTQLLTNSQYLETLCDYLYDDLRPRILHEPRLTVLCEVCTVLQALMVLDQPLDDEIEEDEEKSDELGRLHIRHILQMVLQDAQTRLFFKAQAVIQSEIRYYAPTAQDLAYPDKLAGRCYCLLSIFAKGMCSRPGSTDRIRNSREAEHQPPVRGSRAQPTRDMVPNPCQDRLGALPAPRLCSGKPLTTL
jgi:hypothetical protein